ncbi:HAD family hydrolase [Sulfobacillus harzensis]|uniref:HAD family hydrolase n=1 Tax=Sulfobacillus harzensis TaxID=2729629 RepID=UPI0030844C02
MVLWDLDGTIQDSESLAKEGTRHGFRTVLGRVPTSVELAQLVGRPVPVVYKEWFGDELAQRILEVGTRFYEERAHKIPIFLGIADVLSRLKATSVMGVVSSKRRGHVLRELESQQLLALFDVIVAQEDTARHKPDPAPLLLAAQRLGVPTKDSVYIGDQPTDILAAAAAGMRSIAALWSDNRVSRFEGAPPTAIAHAPSDVVAVLSQMTHHMG